jgi:hypothetical protein
MSLLKAAHGTSMLEYTPLSMEEIKLANPEKVRISKKKCHVQHLYENGKNVSS